MSGQLAKLFSVLILGLLVQSCGKPSHVEGAPRFTAAHITSPGDGSEFSVSRQATRTWKDYDGDGLSDRMDPDIDDDGIVNLADQYPFDGKKWGEDKDQDGIADFVDFTFSKSSESQALDLIQNEVYSKKKIILINGSDQFSEDEVKQIYSSVLNSEIGDRTPLTSLKVIARYSKDDQIGMTRSDYDPYWEQISFYPNENHLNNVPAFNGSLVHEFGHVHAKENPLLFLKFVDAYDSWISPSDYGASSPEEGYAENFVYELWIQNSIVIDSHRFNNIH